MAEGFLLQLLIHEKNICGSQHRNSHLMRRMPLLQRLCEAAVALLKLGANYEKPSFSTRNFATLHSDSSEQIIRPTENPQAD